MPDIVEIVARAITVAEGDDPDGHTGSLLNNCELWWEHRIPQARAAIAAIKATGQPCGVCGCSVYSLGLGQ